MPRNEQSLASPREISSRSANVSAHRARVRARGGTPPCAATTRWTCLRKRPKARPMSLTDSPRFHRLQTSARSALDILGRHTRSMSPPAGHHFIALHRPLEFTVAPGGYRDITGVFRLDADSRRPASFSTGERRARQWAGLSDAGSTAASGHRARSGRRRPVAHRRLELATGAGALAPGPWVDPSPSLGLVGALRVRADEPDK